MKRILWSGRALLFLLAVAATGCRTRMASTQSYDWYGDGSFTALPQIGGALGVGRVLDRTKLYDFSAELEGNFQFISDRTLANDNFPGPGLYEQIRAGVKFSGSPGYKRHVTCRAGVVAFHAGGQYPLIVDKGGNYIGGYLGIGFETDLTPRLTMGPELRGLFMGGKGQLNLVPQFCWHLEFKF